MEVVTAAVPAAEWKALLAAIALAMALSAAAGILRGLIEQTYSLGRFVRTVLASILVGVLVGLGLESVELVVAVKAAIIVMASIVAEDVLSALRTLAGLLGKDPLAFMTRILLALRGQQSKGDDK